MKYDLILGHGTTIVDANAGLVTPTGGSTVLSVDAPMIRNGATPYHGELQYLGLLQELVDKAEAAPVREDRTGTGTYSVFGRQIRFDLAAGFPLLTTKRVPFKAVVAELLWFLSGSTNTNDLDATIWNEWAAPDGSLGPIYGQQWRAWRGAVEADSVSPYLERLKDAPDGYRLQGEPIDQITQLVENLREKPNDRGHIVSAWNVADLPDMALRPCHCLFQFYVDDGKLSCQLYQRSGDIFLGVPFNIASYALLTQMIARELDLELGEFVHTFGDLHLYSNHVDQAKEQLRRCPHPFPRVVIPNHGNNRAKPGIFEIKPSHIDLVDYFSHPSIKAEVSI